MLLNILVTRQFLILKDNLFYMVILTMHYPQHNKLPCIDPKKDSNGHLKIPSFHVIIL